MIKTVKEQLVQWIPCNQRLPDDDIDVLVHGPKMIGNPAWLAYHDGEINGWIWCDGKVVDVEITHWMDIPSPPE